MLRICDVKPGYKIQSPRHGLGLVCDTTTKAITVIFENGRKVRITYKDVTKPFYSADFY